MVLSPIHGQNGDVVDYFEDGLPPEEPSSAPALEDGAPDEDTALLTEEAGLEESSDHLSRPWAVPDMLKGPNDLFLGTTVHHDDGDSQGPLITLLVREVREEPDGIVTIRTYRAAELSKQAFLDDLQQAIAVTMQAHVLACIGQQRKEQAEKAKRKERQASAMTRTSPVGSPASSPAKSLPPVQPTASSRGAVAVKETEKPTKPKYAPFSLFD